ncbi:AGAP008134-PA-like protein [Anopheles sinensis]|uniref:AGAP008134-PA-like protein n=1 Tax=Anopheles sinensis TaxID=74873 RepID=A0A084W881_ANOSI|nr:AGAP008134-PA-like protein [Anopheles sinensis]
MATAVSDCSVPYNPANETRPSNAEDFPNFRDFQIVKMVKHFLVITDGSKQQLRLGFKCRTCGQTFNKTMQLLGHIRLHFEDEHTCRNCGKYFFDPNKLQIHVKAKHTVATVVKCQLGCDSFQTPSYKSMQMHYERYHCVKIRMRELRKMDDAIRNGGTVMTQLVSLKPKRKRVHTPLEVRGPPSSGEESQESAEAAGTGDSTSEPMELVAVLNQADEEDDVEEEIEQHEALINFEQPEDERVYDDMQCCVCGAIFGNELQLEMHENSHTTPFECSFCSMAFRELAEIRVHYQHKHQDAGKTPHAQLAAVNPYQQTTAATLTPIQQNTQIAWPITATPITTNQHHLQQAQQILPPVQNQIEIIPLHSGPPAGTSTAGSPHGIITTIAPQHQHMQQVHHAQPQQTTLAPIHISLKDASGNVISGGPAGGGAAGEQKYIQSSFIVTDASLLTPYIE